MARADRFLAHLDHPESPVPEPGDPRDDALLDVVIHVACADGMVQDEEFDLLQRVMPTADPGEVFSRVAELTQAEPDLDALAARLPGEDERRAALRLAARVAWSDEHLDTEEKRLLLHLAEAFDLPREAVEEALAGVVGEPRGAVPSAAVRRAVLEMPWAAATLEEDTPVWELEALVPADAGPIAKLVVEGEDRVGIYASGLAAQFKEGLRFLRWEDVSSYTRVPVFGAAVRLVDRAGACWTIEDPRLREVGAMLDRVWSGAHT